MKNIQAFYLIKNGSYIQNETLDPRIHKVTEMNELLLYTYVLHNTAPYKSDFLRK